MLFNQDPTKPAQEVIFWRKKDDSVYPSIIFNDIPIEKAWRQKHLGIYLDEKLNFKMHLKTVFKVNKGISIIKMLRFTLKWKSLLFSKRF